MCFRDNPSCHSQSEHGLFETSRGESYHHLVAPQFILFPGLKRNEGTIEGASVVAGAWSFEVVVDTIERKKREKGWLSSWVAQQNKEKKLIF